ncbi:helix-turn-helix domain-containing protein [Paenibacillus sp. MBLB4367]|uniref:helix-turn-helix domain-containing protein n=1 Tax=Paenibacillus sp. MBLB4367 TaxID=3384767 RepID=UPI0039080660
MMNKWYNRLVVSYLPIFLVIAIVLILISFFALSDLARRTTLHSNDVFGRQVLRTVDNDLRAIDNAMVRQLFATDLVQRFAMTSGKTTDPAPYELFVSLQNMKSSYPMIDSVYVLRKADGMFVSDTSFEHRDRVADREFIDHALETQDRLIWSSAREYRSSSAEPSRTVVSLAKTFPFFDGGVIVVNVRVDDLRLLLKELVGPNMNIITFFDQGGTRITGTAAELIDSLRLKSDYTGWEMTCGVKYISVVHTMSGITLLLAGLAALSVAGGILWIMIASRRNYAPIRKIMTKIDMPETSHITWKRNQGDEFTAIEQTIERMRENTGKLDKLQEEHRVTGLRLAFLDLLEGRLRTDEKTESSLEMCGLSMQFEWMSAAVAEIDKQRHFADVYPERDRELLKYAFQTCLRELSVERGITVWCEWLASGRLCLLVQASGGDPEALNERLTRLCHTLREWTLLNLPFTVTIGIGDSVDDLDKLPLSYEKALHRVSCKSSLGGNRVITEADLASRPQLDLFQSVQMIRPLAHSVRTGDSSLPAQLERFFRQLRCGVFSHDELISIMNYTLYSIHREVWEQSEALGRLWESEAQPILVSMLDWAETIDEMDLCLQGVLEDFALKSVQVREHRSLSATMNKIRAYIDQHYANPNMSLTHLAHVFGMNPSHLSRFFKEELSINFTDYLIDLRMNGAKRLLTETDSSIQDIAETVGYTTAIAFIRVFKRSVGMTPGMYRKAESAG